MPLFEGAVKIEGVDAAFEAGGFWCPRPLLQRRTSGGNGIKAIRMPQKSFGPPYFSE
jgi:hypothetical protein